MQTVKNPVILITGATDGLGKRVAHDLAAQGATILVHGRSREKGKATLKEIRDATGNQKLIYYNADFSSLDEVRRLTDEIQADQARLDVLINNAGIGAGRRQPPARNKCRRLRVTLRRQLPGPLPPYAPATASALPLDSCAHRQRRFGRPAADRLQQCDAQ